MTNLYSCRHAGDQYRITKFDSDMNVEASYLTDGSACDCPAGPRPTCRHRQMLPRFIQRNAVGTEWFFDFDRGGWVQVGLEILEELVGTGKVDLGEATFEPLPPPPEPHSVTGSTADFDSASTGSNPVEAAKGFPRRFG